MMTAIAGCADPADEGTEGADDKADRSFSAVNKGPLHDDDGSEIARSSDLLDADSGFHRWTFRVGASSTKKVVLWMYSKSFQPYFEITSPRGEKWLLLGEPESPCSFDGSAGPCWWARANMAFPRLGTYSFLATSVENVQAAKNAEPATSEGEYEIGVDFEYGETPGLRYLP